MPNYRSQSRERKFAESQPRRDEIVARRRLKTDDRESRSSEKEIRKSCSGKRAKAQLARIFSEPRKSDFSDSHAGDRRAGRAGCGGVFFSDGAVWSEIVPGRGAARAD
jgi:hypothetical protein